jgi:hypothetical protein
MDLKSKFRRSAEAGFALTAIATLILAGCGGGGGGNTTNGSGGGSATTTISVTPGKGVMLGALVSIKDANGMLLGSGTTTTGGLATVSIPITAVAPLVVSVSCPTTCQYFDEKTLTMVAGSSAIPDMLAVVPSTSNPNIGVTAATHAAAQYVLASGPLTPASVTAANNAVASQLGLVGVTDILVPPRIINDAATLAAAQTGTTPADRLANFSASLALAASGVSAIDAIASYGNAWKQAALVPASGVIMPPSINPAVVTQHIPTFVANVPNVASAVATQTQQVAASVAAANHFFSDATSANGLREWLPSFGAGVPDVVHIHKLISIGANRYSGVATYKENAVNGWVALGPNYIPNPYVLTSSGWQIYDGADTFVNNQDGTVTFTSPRGVVTERITETALTGPVVCTDPNTGLAVTCANPQNYPAGARSYSGVGGISSVDTYRVWASDTYWTNEVTNLSGVPLTSMPSSGFCVNGDVLTPIAPTPAAGVDNYNVHSTATGACAGADISSALAGVAVGTVKLALRATGIGGVSVLLATASQAGNLAYLDNNFIAVVNGNLMAGDLRLAGSSATKVFYLNQVALDAELMANGLPATSVVGSATPVPPPTPTPTTGLSAKASVLVDAQVGIIRWDSVNGNASASKVNITPTATAGTYTTAFVSMAKSPIQGWVTTNNGSAPAGVTYTSYELLPTGWAVNTTNTMVDNGTSFSYPFGTMTVAKTDLSGTPVTCGSPQGSAPIGAVDNYGTTVAAGICAQNATYPANSTLYTMTDNQTLPIYNLNDVTGVGITPIVFTDEVGTPLTSLPTLSSIFCLANNNGANMTVHVPIANPANGADNYSMHGALTCTLSDINAAIATPAYGTVLVTLPNTGVAGVAVAEVTSSTGWSYILAYHLNKWMQGWVAPAGIYTTYFVNRVAADTQLPANGLTVLP